MSFDTARNWVYKLRGKKLRLFRYTDRPDKEVDTDGRVGTSDWHYLRYPDESITAGLRIEYTSLVSPFVEEDPDITADSDLTLDSSISETSHVNLNRMLSLAVVEYLKAQLAEKAGNIDAKEYFMKQFNAKLADNESNKKYIFVAQPVSPFSIMR